MCFTLLLLLIVVSPCVAGKNDRSEEEAAAHEAVRFEQDGVKRFGVGQVLVEAEDGGILFETTNQTIWPLQPDEILSRKVLDTPLKQPTKEELAKQVLKELPHGFKVYTTNHYIICYNTSRGYAEWSGALFERLHRAFNNYWRRRGIKLQDTPPLIALVFRDRKSYRAYGTQELGSSINRILGYYSFKTNRIAMYDLLGGKRFRSTNQINQMLRTERTVATVIHEATHQLAFNSGMHQRFADIPLWLSEGLAIYFESPDLSSKNGWKTIGKVNSVRHTQFLRSASQREPESLLTLTSDDERFQTAGLASDAYAESWAFCYYLIRSEPKEFTEYLKLLQQKKPLEVDSPLERIETFKAAFGKPPQAMNDAMLKQIRRIR